MPEEKLVQDTQKILMAEQLKSVAPSLALGIVRAHVRITEHESSLWSEIYDCIGEIKGSLVLDGVAGLSEIKALRDAYRAMGKDASRYRPSQEALLRRILQGKGLFQINTVVDINNLVSLRSRHSVGSYNAERLQGAVTFRIGRQGESYKGIGKDLINLEGLAVLADDDGPFGSPTSDSERAMVTLETWNLMMVIYAFSGQDCLADHLRDAAKLLESYADAKITHTGIVCDFSST